MQEQAEKLARAVSQLYEGDLITPTGGNVSCRWEENFLVTPSGKNKGSLLPEDMLLVDQKGKVLCGEGRPSIEVAMHLAIYQAQQHINAVIHDHALSPLLVGACQLPLTPVALETCPFQELPRLPFYPPGSEQLAREAAMSMGRGRAVLLTNHGALTGGGSLEEAVHLSFMLERAARMSLWVALIKRPALTIPGDLMDKLKM